jgi:hypothetical protein
MKERMSVSVVLDLRSISQTRMNLRAIAAVSLLWGMATIQ